MNAIDFAESSAGYESIAAVVRTCAKTTARFPCWPFEGQGVITLLEFDVFMGGYFGDAVRLLCAQYGDSELYACGASENAKLFYATHDFWPAFAIRRGDPAEQFRRALSTDRIPSSGYISQMGILLDSISLVGDSKQWAAWGLREQNIVVLLSNDAFWVPKSAGLPTWTTEDLRDFSTLPLEWGSPANEWLHFRELLESQQRQS
ncbi:hypothetical protein ACO03V_04500 [Microbacterium sp. HMH0099]|uniref:hypothetical protein n=1 Tax=Microbacterium sp. HMH0099 TaxID=3414026 RepID=UPI003BF6A0D0